MTNQIGNHGLSCISDTDYAAFALSIQCNAKAIDDSLANQSQAIGNYLDRPWQQAVNSSSMSINSDSSGGAIGPFGRVGESIGPGNPVYTDNDLAFGTQWPAGIYQIGASINWSLVTPTANSYRELSVFGVATIDGETNIATTFVDYVSAIDFQGDGGNNGALNVWGYLDTRGLVLRSFMSFFTHSNTGSALTVAPNNWRMWAMYMGSGLNI